MCHYWAVGYFHCYLNQMRKPVSHSSYNSNTVILCKLRKMLSDLHTSHLMLFHFTCLCSFLQWNWKMLIIKIIEIFQYFATNEKLSQIWVCLRFGKVSDFVSFPFFEFILVKSLKNFGFESQWNNLTFLD